VRGWLLSRDAAQTRLGLKRVAAWRSRGRVPHSVDATAQIAPLLLAQEPATKGGRGEEEAQRLAMGLAIIRLVNGLTSAVQNGAYAVPVSVAAARVGLPRFLVDLRHAATHAALPPTPQLWEACEVASAWLAERYWWRASAAAAAPAAAALPADTTAAICAALADYRTAVRAETAPFTDRAEAARRVAMMSAKERHKMHRASRQCLTRIVAFVNGSSPSALSDSLVIALIRHGFLVPFTCALRHLPLRLFLS